MPANALEKLGYPGPSHIKQILSKPRKVNTFLNAVRKFQTENGLQLESLEPALKLLDMHDVRRKEFHELAVVDLGERLVDRIKELGKTKTEEANKKLERQLEKCFPLYSLPQIRPIVLETLKQLQSIPESYLEQILHDPELYALCAVNVKQQLWLIHNEEFEKAVQPVIDDYLKAKRNVECTIDPLTTNFFTGETTKSRRQWPQIISIIQMVGSHEQLYLKLIALVKKRYKESGNVHLCSLRSELVISAHEMTLDFVVKADPCYEFAKCLDTCVRDKLMDANLTTRLKNILEKPFTLDEFCDIAMVASDSHVVHFLCSMVIKVLRESSGLPRDSMSLQVIVKILAIGSTSQKLFSMEELPSTFVDAIFVTKFLPALGKMAIEDVMRFDLLKAQCDQVDEFNVKKYRSDPSETLVTFTRAELIAGLLFVHQAMETLPNKKRVGDVKGLMRYLKHFRDIKDKVHLMSPWCHLFVHRLLSSNVYENIIAKSEVQELVIEDILLANVTVDCAIKYQILRIVSHMHSIIGVQKCSEIMERVSPEELCMSLSEDEKECYEKAYKRILVKITPKPMEELPHPTVNPMVMGTPAHIPHMQHPSMTPRGPPGSSMMPPSYMGGMQPGQLGPPTMGPPTQFQQQRPSMTPRRQPAMTPRQ